MADPVEKDSLYRVAYDLMKTIAANEAVDRADRNYWLTFKISIAIADTNY
jgi:hypothetical protein